MSVNNREETSAGDEIPSRCQVIAVHVTELKQLFNSLDPSPFHDRDLDPDAEEYIVGWSRELPRDVPLALLVHLDRAAGQSDEAAILRNAIHQFFHDRSEASRRQLRQLFRRGRISLVIGLAFLGAAVGASQLLENWLHPSGFVDVLRESLLIGGWVAMWRPIEIFLYDWWPIGADARLSDRLAAMPVRIRYLSSEVASDAWQRDWPATRAATD
jgi:hypothetical protein